MACVKNLVRPGVYVLEGERDTYLSGACPVGKAQKRSPEFEIAFATADFALELSWLISRGMSSIAEKL